MTVPQRRLLKAGVYAPLPTFFDESDELDLSTYRRHLLRLARQGIIPVCAGSLGEAVHLTPEERTTLTRCTRHTLDDAGLSHVPIVAGVGAPSTRETIALAHRASAAGADAGMVILPAYYAASFRQDPSQIVQYYIDICAGSPIPILLYNFPANAAGLDMDIDTILEIVRRSPNLCGVKLTCPGRMEKLAQLRKYLAAHPRPEPLMLLDGCIDDFIDWKVKGGLGTVSGVSNMAPAMTCRLWEIRVGLNAPEEDHHEAEKLLEMLATFDSIAMPLGVRGLKYCMAQVYGEGNRPRRPLLPLEAEDAKGLDVALRKLLAAENAYAA